jgi:hypothetical protein
MSNQIAVTVLTTEQGKFRKYYLCFTVTFGADNGNGIVIKPEEMEDPESDVRRLSRWLWRQNE